MSEGRFVAVTETGELSGVVDENDGPSLLLLHGGPGLTDYMGMLAAETEGWRTIRYQQRGLAPSTTQGPFTVARHVADATAVLDETGTGKAVVLGHSWGSHLALQLALRHSDRVAGVVFVDGLGVTDDGRATETAQEQRRRLTPEANEQLAALDRQLSTEQATDEAMLAALRLLWPAYFANPETAPPLAEDMRISFAASQGTLGSMFQELAEGFAERLRELSVPTVVVVAEKSPIPTEAGAQVAELVPNARVVRVKEAGHLPWLEQPGCIEKVLKELKQL